jgi:putative N6-adenine-specific DNA methylase
MKFYQRRSRIIVTCSKRIAPFLALEIEQLGFEPKKIFATGVELIGSLNDCIKLNLHLRCASQVLYTLKEFQCTDPDDLYNKVYQLPWEGLIEKDGYFSVTSHVDHPSITTPLFANVKVKDAIVDHFRDKYGKRPNSGSDYDKAVINLFWKNEEAALFIDTSGETLSKHGYRKIPGKAPMLESLAAATILASKWDRQSAFVNPMCGSGTLAIEALMSATKRMPGLYRNNYSFMHFIGYEESVYEAELANIKQMVREVPGMRIIASDISEDAINVSKINARMAGVEELMEFEVCDFRDTEIPEGGGTIFFNPEYGERLGEETELEEIYKEIGDFMKKSCKGYKGYIFTGNLELAKKIGLKTTRRIEFYNGKIDCRLMEYELYDGTKRVPKAEVISD